MKPIKLTLSAFGPFSGRTEIDFEKIGESGIYLITGDTGSGKTTIFDAVSFALYGEPSGGRELRAGKSFRSDYAASDAETYVIFEFEQHGRRYIAERAPTYTRKAKIGTGTAENMAYARFTDVSSGQIWTRIDETDEKIKEIIGLDRKQFAQTVMIAQGEFRRILNAKSDERKQIFQKLFNTSRYEMFQNRLREMNSDCTKQMEELNGRIISEIDRVRLSPLLRTDFTKEGYGWENAGEFLAELGKYNSWTEKNLKEAAEEFEQLSKQSETLVKKIAEAEETNRRILRLEEKKSALERQLEGSSGIEDKEKRLESAKKAAEVLVTETLIADKQRSLTAKKERFAKLSVLLKNQEETVNKARRELEAAEKSAENLPEMRAEFVRQQEILPVFNNLERLKISYAADSKKLFSLKAEWEDAENSYKTMLNRFILGQAGILARGLREGMPCPVCGSEDHPAPAKMTDEIPTQEAVAAAEKKAAKTRKDYSDFGGGVTALKAKIEESESDERIKGSSIVKIEERLAALKREISNTEARLAGARERIAAASSSYSALNAELSSVNSDVSALEPELENLRNSFEKAVADKGFDNVEDYHRSKLESDMLRALEKEIADYRSETKTLESAVKELEKAVDGREICDVNALRNKKSELTEGISAADLRRIELEKLIDINKNAASELEKLLKKQDEIRRKWAEISDLYKTVSGQQSGGKAKFSFEAYVQQHYFRQMTVSANERLKVLTDGTYMLRCKEKAKNLRQQTGLDLDVFDRNTGQWRDVSTLSGGESFMASIALALGLSDVVQENSGGIQLDSMFIDEGFGTLDENSLRQAINLLDRLADGKRLIGIISHVAELKNRIDRKIIVTKTASGSEVEIIV